MARGITEQDVLEAADALLSRGERPTIERVRQELGRGSPNTVNRHLDAWWASLSARLQGRPGHMLPAPLLGLCSRLYEGLAAQAQAEAAKSLSDGQARLKAELERLAASEAGLALERAGAAATAESLSAELASLRDRNEALAAEKAKLQVESARLANIADEARKGLQTARMTLDAAQRKHSAELERVRAQWEGNEKRWLKEIDHLRDEAKRQRQAHDGEQKALRDKVKLVERDLMSALKARADAEEKQRQREAALAKEREARLQAEAASRATKSIVEAIRKRSPTLAAKAKRRSPASVSAT